MDGISNVNTIDCALWFSSISHSTALLSCISGPSIFSYQMSVFKWYFFKCFWFTLGNWLFKIGLNFLAGRYEVWIYPYNLLNLTLKANKMYIHIWKLVNCGNYRLSATYLIPYMLHFQVGLNGLHLKSFTRFEIFAESVTSTYYIVTVVDYQVCNIAHVDKLKKNLTN